MKKQPYKHGTIVVLTKALPDSGLTRGAHGVIVDNFSNGKEYVLEFENPKERGDYILEIMPKCDFEML